MPGIVRSRYVDLNRPTFHWGRPLDEGTQGPMDWPSFLLFVRTVLPGRAPKLRLDWLQRLVVRSYEKPVAVPAFTVQNGRADLEVTRRAPTIDRAQIGRICGFLETDR
jgi:hypothetical protein